MNKSNLRVFLALQLFAVFWAGAVFSIFSSRLLAGAMAGSYFLGIGLYMLAKVIKWPDKWKSLTLYPLLLHVFVITIPMILTRFLQVSLDFTELEILGIPAPVFHRMSTVIFSALIIATLTDLLRLRALGK